MASGMCHPARVAALRRSSLTASLPLGWPTSISSLPACTEGTDIAWRGQLARCGTVSRISALLLVRGTSGRCGRRWHASTAVVTASCFGTGVAVTACGARQSATSTTSDSGAHHGLRYRRVARVRTQKHSKERLQKLPPVRLGEDGSSGSQAPSVYVYPGSPASKRWMGFGGSFTEASAVTLQKMSPGKQDEVMRAYFDEERGLGYSLGRVPIGSCDFGLGNWTCGDLVDGDLKLEGFSIERYHASILPMIHRAANVAGSSITMLASPWSPPPWMKTKQIFNGDGRLLPQCRDAWALHYVRFLQEMAKVGVPIWGVSVQNEPEAAQSWESCLYSAEEERDFVRDHLGPALSHARLEDVKILIWDHNRDGMLERAAVAYQDPEAAKYIWGVGYHWYGDARFETWPPRAEVIFADRQNGEALRELRACAGFDNVRLVSELRPDKHILFTEGCQELGGRPLSAVMGDWKMGERYAMNVINDLNSGCEGWIDWNLCLDETGGPNHVGNLCVAPIICDTQSDKVHYQPSFWYLGHFSRFIRPGARRVLCSSSRDALEVTAFLNEDGSLAVVVMNQSEDAVDFWFKVGGHGHADHNRSVPLTAPPRSITSLLVDDGEAEPALLSALPDVVRHAFFNLWHAVTPKERYQKYVS